jgi:NAD(P)-dependent dehydrogenase (short-subunit alcohol dehydrogenase family)
LNRCSGPRIPKRDVKECEYLATAWAFAEAGASVSLVDRDEQTLSRSIEGIRSAGHNAIGLNCDVTDKAQVTTMFEQAATMYGRLDAAFNNAGINSDSASLLDTSDDEFDRIINVNLRGVWNCMKAELRRMMAQGSGAIVMARKDEARTPQVSTESLAPDAVRRARVCRPWNSHQRGLPWNGEARESDASARPKKS